MLSIVVTADTNHIKRFGQGTTTPGPGERVLRRDDVSAAAFQAEITALPGWAGDLRMVVVDAQGKPLRVEGRALQPDEQAADALTAQEARRESARAQVNAADIAGLVQSAGAAATVEALRAQVVSLARLVGRLAEAQGHTPAVD